MRRGEWRAQATEPLGFTSASCFIFLISAIWRPTEALGDGRGCQCSGKHALGNQSTFMRKVGSTLHNCSPATFPKANFRNNNRTMRSCSEEDYRRPCPLTLSIRTCAEPAALVELNSCPNFQREQQASVLQCASQLQT